MLAEEVIGDHFSITRCRSSFLAHCRMRAKRTKHRSGRILFAMHDLSLFPRYGSIVNAQRSCGDTSGHYHPHGEAVDYPTWSTWRSLLA